MLTEERTEVALCEAPERTELAVEEAPDATEDAPDDTEEAVCEIPLETDEIPELADELIEERPLEADPTAELAADEMGIDEREIPVEAGPTIPVVTTRGEQQGVEGLSAGRNDRNRATHRRQLLDQRKLVGVVERREGCHSKRNCRLPVTVKRSALIHATITRARVLTEAGVVSGNESTRLCN